MNFEEAMKRLDTIGKELASLADSIEIIEDALDAEDEAEADVAFAQEMLNKGVNKEAISEWLKSKNYDIKVK